MYPKAAELPFTRRSSPRDSIKLGGLTFETLLVGHGDPIQGGASGLVAELGATG